MSGNTTNVPAPMFGPAGFSAPSEVDILAGVQADFNAAFGGNMNTALTTPQGQIATSVTALIGDANAQFLALANGVDPAYASGRMQDGIGRIYFMTRNPAMPTVLQVACNGLAGVKIPVGALIADNSGNIYACTQASTIASNGTIALAFANLLTGPLPVPAGGSLVIYQVIPGWDTVAIVSGVVGSVVESRSDFELRRQLSVASNGAGFLPAILGAVLAVPGVIDAFVADNTAATTITVNGLTLAPNSLCVVVAGGDPQAVAKAIWSKKNPGCSYTGNTTVTVFDSNSGYSQPFPDYSVSFQVPNAGQTAIDVTILNSPIVPANAEALVQAAVFAAFVGADGGPRARIGSALFASRFYAGVAALGPWAQIVQILVQMTQNPDAGFTGTITNGVLTVTAVSLGALAVGQHVFGTLLAPGTRIVSIIAGTGGVGTYGLTPSQTIANNGYQSIFADQNSLTYSLNRVPTLNPGDVRLILI